MLLGDRKMVLLKMCLLVKQSQYQWQNLPPYMLTLISKMGTSVITLTFGPSSQVNKKSTWSRHSDTTTPSASCPSSVSH